MTTTESSWIETGQQVLAIEALALQEMTKKLDNSFSQACELLFHCQGRIIVTGMGKSGHIAKKIAATLASTGSPAFFVHPAEAQHGDFGMFVKNDVVLALSHSGNTEELVVLIPFIKTLGVPLIGITGNKTSRLAQNSNVVLHVPISQEACALNLAPTTSTTLTLALGDALAIALQKARGFTPEDFAKAHPGGSLGKRLLLQVTDMMHRGASIPKVKLGTFLPQVVVETSQKGLGMAVVVDEEDRACGVFTDGDLRRTFDQKKDLHSLPIEHVMTTPGTYIHPSAKATEALALMREKRITGLFVVDDNQRVLGAFNMQDLLQQGIV